MIKNNIIIASFRKTSALLLKNEKQKALAMMILLLFNSFLDILGLAAILPIILILLQDNIVKTNKYFKWIYDIFGFVSEQQFLIVLALVVLGFLIIKNVLSLWIYKTQVKFSYNLYRRFSSHLFKIYQEKGLLFFKNNNPNFIIRNIVQIPLDFTNNIILHSITLINEGLIIFVIIIIILIYDPLVVALLIIFIVPVFSIFYRVVRNKSHTIQTEINELNPKLSINLLQSTYGFIDVKMTNSEEFFLINHNKLLIKSSRFRTLAAVLQQSPTKVIETGLMTAIILVALYGVIYIDDKSHITGLLSVFALSAYRVLPSINRLMIALIGIRGFQYTFDVLSQIISDNNLTYNKNNEIKFSSHIELKDLSFNYDDNDRLVISKINIRILKNDTIGIIGRSGSGKSTLVNLLLGFYTPSKGAILIDDVNLNKNNVANWRSKIGYVQQEVFILDASLAENIAFGVPKNQIDSMKLNRAIDLASLTDIVKLLPLGVWTNIGDRGALLSGGQRQRVGIARALYHGATILIMDEATSALDSGTENEINESIARLSENNMTIIIIAHRFTTLKNCKTIYELENGSLVKEWSYAELISENIHLS